MRNNSVKTHRFFSCFGGKKRDVSNCFLFFGVCQLLVCSLQIVRPSFFHQKGDTFGALCVGATLLAPRRAAVLGALQDILKLGEDIL